MIAVLKPIDVKPLTRPVYTRWDLVRYGDPDAWIRANRELIQGWYNDLAQYADEEELDTFDAFCLAQFDIERARLEELRADAKLDDCYRESEAE